MEIRHALDQAERDEQVLGIVLTGEGRGFCAGMDMNALNEEAHSGKSSLGGETRLGRGTWTKWAPFLFRFQLIF